MIPTRAFTPRVLPLSIALLALSRVRLKGYTRGLLRPHQTGPSSSRLMRTWRLTWAFSTKPKPIIMVNIEVPP